MGGEGAFEDEIGRDGGSEWFSSAPVRKNMCVPGFDVVDVFRFLVFLVVWFGRCKSITEISRS